jgi:hypothetical protein
MAHDRIRQQPDQEPIVLICAPTTMEAVPGSTRDTCSSCGAAVWVAPSGRLLLAARPGLRLRCLPEFLAAVEAGHVMPVMPPTDQQWQELREYWREGGH